MLHYIPGIELLQDMSVDELLDRTYELWELDTPPSCYLFHLGPIHGGWRFAVVSNWGNWMERKRQKDFEAPRPNLALIDFLQYVRDNRIDVAELAKEQE